MFRNRNRNIARKNTPSPRQAKRSARRATTKRLLLESLEARQLLTAVAWDAGGDGLNFSDPQNWSNDTVPGAVDDVTINLDGAGTEYRIDVNTDHAVNSLNINSTDAQLRLNSGTFTVNTIEIDAGRLVSVGGNVVANRITNDDRIALGRTQTLDVEEIDNNGSFIIQSSATSRLTIDGTLRNSGEFSLNPNGQSTGQLTVENGLIVNETEGVITIGGPGTRTQTVRTSFENAGELNFAGSRVTFDGGNTISNTGSLSFGDGLTFSTFGSSAVVDQRAGNLTAAGDVLLNNGAFIVSGGEVTISDRVMVENQGTITVSGGNVDLQGGRLLVNGSGTFNFTGGDIVGSRNVEVFGNAELNILHDGAFQATLRNQTTVSGGLADGQSLTIDANNSQLTSTAGFVNEGLVLFNNPGTSAQRLVTSDGLPFENATTGIIRVTRDTPSSLISMFFTSINNSGTIEIDAVVSDSKLNTLVNKGVFSVTPNGRYTRSTAGSGAEGAYIQHSGALTNNGQVDGGGLNFEYLGGQVTGPILPSRLTLRATENASGEFHPRRSFEGQVNPGQSVVFDTDSVQLSGPVRNRGTILFLAPNDNTTTQLQSLGNSIENTIDGILRVNTAANSTAAIEGTVINDGDFQIEQGVAKIDAILNRGIVDVSETATLFLRRNSTYVQTDGQLLGNGQVQSQGTVEYAGGEIAGVVELQSTGVLDVAAGVQPATFRMIGGGEILSDIPAGIEVQISNVGSGTDSYDTKDNLVVAGILRLGDSLSTGAGIELDLDGELIIAPSGILQTRGTTVDITASLKNQGQFQIESPTTIGAAAEHSNQGTLEVLNTTARFNGLGLTNSIAGRIVGSGSISLGTGGFGANNTEFANEGIIAPGLSPGNLTINAPNSILTSSSRIESELEGLTSGSQFDQINFSGDLLLDGSLSINTSSEFSPQLGDTFSVLTANSIAGDFVAVDLQGNPSAAYSTDILETQVRLTAVAAATDLEANIVSVPTAATATEEIAFQYSVTNRGSVTAATSWTDRIYLSPTPEFDITTASLISQIIRNESLGAGQSYSNAVTATLPSVLAGQYHIVVLVDSRLQTGDANRNNNQTFSIPLDVNVQSIALDDLKTLELAAGQSRLFQLDVPIREDILVSSTSSIDGSHELLFQVDGIPSLANPTLRAFNVDNPSNEIRFNSADFASLFVTVRAKPPAGTGTSISLQIQSQPLTAASVAPEEVGNTDLVTLDIAGAGFTDSSSVEIRDANGQTIAAHSLKTISSNRILASFNMSETALGAADILVSEGSESTELNSRLEIVEANPGRTLSQLTLPTAIRNLRNGQLSVETTHVGNTDSPAALRSLVVFDGNLRLTSSENFQADVLEFLVIDSNGTAGTLSPGFVGTNSFTFNQNGPVDEVAISLQTPRGDLALNHFAVLEDLRPAEILPDRWEEIYRSYLERVGSTYSDYELLLANAASELQEFGIVTGDVATLRAFELIKAGADTNLSEQLGEGAPISVVELQAALTRIAKPLSLDAIVRLEGGDRLSALSTAVFTVVLEQNVFRAETALKQQLGDAFFAALDPEEREEIRSAIESQIGSGGTQQVGPLTNALIASFSADDLGPLEVFREHGAFARQAIEQVLEILQNSAAEILGSLTPQSFERLMIGIRVELENGKTVDQLLQEVTADATTTTDRIIAKAIEHAAANIFTNLRPSLLQVLDTDSSELLRSAIVRELASGTSEDRLRDSFAQGRLTLVDLLLADEAARDRAIDEFLLEVDAAVQAPVLGQLNGRQEADLRAVVGAAIDRKSDFLKPQRFANVFQANEGAGVRAVLEAAQRQLQVDEFLDEIENAEAGNPLEGIAFDELNAIGNVVEQIVQERQLGNPRLGFDALEFRNRLLENQALADQLAREIEIDQAIDRIFENEFLGPQGRDDFKELLQGDLGIDVNEIKAADAAGILEIVREDIDRLIQQGAVEGIQDGIARLVFERQANEALEELRGDPDLQQHIAALNPQQLEELVAGLADANLADLEFRRGVLGIDAANDQEKVLDIVRDSLERGNIARDLDQAADERQVEAVLDFLNRENDVNAVLDALGPQEREGLRLLILANAEGADNNQELAEFIGQNLAQDVELDVVVEQLRQLQIEDAAEQAFQELELDAQVQPVLADLDANSREKLLGVLRAELNDSEDLDLEAVKQALLAGDGDVDLLIVAAFAEAEAEDLFDELLDDAAFADVVKRLNPDEQREIVLILKDVILGDRPEGDLDDILNQPVADVKEDLADERLLRGALPLLAEDADLLPLLDELNDDDFREILRLIAQLQAAGEQDLQRLRDLIADGGIEHLEKIAGELRNERLANELLDGAAKNNRVFRMVGQLNIVQRNELDQSILDRIAEGLTTEDLANEVKQQSEEDFRVNLDEASVGRAVDDFLGALQIIADVAQLLDGVPELIAQVRQDIRAAILLGIDQQQFAGFLLAANDNLAERLNAPAPNRNTDQFMTQLGQTVAADILASLTGGQLTELRLQTGERNQTMQEIGASVLLDIGAVAPAALGARLNAVGELAAKAELDEAAEQRADLEFIESVLELASPEFRAAVERLSERARNELRRGAREARNASLSPRVFLQTQENLANLEALSSLDSNLNESLRKQSFASLATDVVNIAAQNSQANERLIDLAAVDHFSRLINRLESDFQNNALLPSQVTKNDDELVEQLAGDLTDDLVNNFENVLADFEEQSKSEEDSQFFADLFESANAEFQQAISDLTAESIQTLLKEVRITRESGLSPESLLQRLIDLIDSTGTLETAMRQLDFKQTAGDVFDRAVQNEGTSENVQELASRDQVIRLLRNIEAEIASNANLPSDLRIGREALVGQLTTQLENDLINDFESLLRGLVAQEESEGDSNYLEQLLDLSDEAFRSEVDAVSVRAQGELQQLASDARELGVTPDILLDDLRSQSASAGGLDQALQQASFDRLASEVFEIVNQDNAGRDRIAQLGGANLTETLAAEISKQFQENASRSQAIRQDDASLVTSLGESIQDDLINNFTTVKANLEEAQEAQADEDFLQEILAQPAAAEILEELNSSSDKTRDDLLAFIREKRLAGESASDVLIRLLGIESSLAISEFLAQIAATRRANEVIDLVSKDSVAENLLEDLGSEVSILIQQIEDQFRLNSTLPSALFVQEDTLAETIGAELREQLTTDFSGLRNDLVQSNQAESVSDLIEKLGPAASLDLNTLDAQQLLTLSRLVEGLIELDPELTPSEVADRLFDGKSPFDILDDQTAEDQSSDLIADRLKDDSFQAFFQTLTAEQAAAVHELVRQTLLGPNGSEAKAIAALDHLLTLDSLQAQEKLNQLLAEASVVETLIADVVSDTATEISSSDRGSLERTLRRRLRAGETQQTIADDLQQQGSENFVQSTIQSDVLETIRETQAIVDELLGDNGSQLPAQERQANADRVKDLIEQGKSPNTITEGVKNSGESAVKEVIEQNLEQRAKATELADQVERAQSSLLVQQNESPLSEEEKERLRDAIATRLADGESTQQILFDLNSLPVRKFRKLLGRDTNNDAKKDNDAATHQSNAAITQKGAVPKTRAEDPNDILGPNGFGEQGFLKGDQRLEYTIRFENLPTATADAQEVFVTQPLDEDFDLSTFELTAFGFGDVLVEIPQGNDSFESLVDLRDSLGLFVSFKANIDPTSRVANWEFRAIDPATGDLIADPILGFLPPNTVPGVGEGFVQYSVRPKSDLTSGTRLDAEATIVFDLESPLSTPPIFNTIDARPPTSLFAPLPTTVETLEFPIAWSGSDDTSGSGISHFDVFVGVDGGPLELFLNDTPENSTVFSGEDNRSYRFSVRAFDNVGRVEDKLLVTEATTTVRFNDAPFSNDDVFTTTEDSSTALDVLANDFDVDGDSLNVEVTRQPTNGTAIVRQSGAIEYTPVPNYFGDDSFVYSVSDNRGGVASATAFVTVTPVNDQPNAGALTTSVHEDSSTTIEVLSTAEDIDGDQLSARVVRQPQNGTLTRTQDGSLVYQPKVDFVGKDTFEYILSDDSLDSPVALAEITVLPVNDRPIAMPDSVQGTEDTQGIFSVKANDIDVDGDNLRVDVVQQPSNGQATVAANGDIIFVPESDFFGIDNLLYRVTDPSGASRLANVQIEVSPVNDAPRVKNPIADVTVNEDANDQTIELSGIFDDIDSDNLSLSALSSDGSLVTTSLIDSQLVLSFAANQNGAATVTVTASDGQLVASDTFNVIVSPVNDAPRVKNPIADVTVNEDANDQTIELSGIFDDIDSDNLSLSALSSDGSLVTTSLIGTQLVLSFAANQNGAATVTVTASDGQLVVSDTFNVIVNANQQRPVELTGKTLRIQGDLGDTSTDRVSLSKERSRIKIVIKQGSGRPQQFEFLSSEIDVIDVELGEGNDVLLTSSNFRKPIRVEGGQGNDWIETGRANDEIIDMFGNNTILAQAGSDRIVTGDGRDRIFAGAGRDIVHAGGGNDYVNAGAGADIVVGGAGHDWIVGDKGRDLLIGGLGRDIMFGGPGQDLMVGGATVHDENDDALMAIAAEWTSNRSLQQRKSNITNGSGSQTRKNDEYFFGADDMIDDHAWDFLFGGADEDWKL